MGEENLVGKQEERGVTFGSVCSVIFRGKIIVLLLAVTLVCTLILTLFVHYFINPKRVSFDAEFNFHVVRSDASSDRYVSGQFFVEEETLIATKESDETFADVDIESMLQNGESPISVSYEIVGETVGEEDETTLLYRLSVNGSLFPNQRVAISYLRALIGFIKDDAVNDAKALSAKDASGFNSYQAWLKTYAQAQTYEEKLSILASQRNDILALYDGWIEDYGGLYIIESKNSSLTDLRQTASAVFSDTMHNDLAGELNASAYFPDSEDNATLQSRRNTYAEQLDLNQCKLENLTKQLSALLEEYKGIDGTASSLMPQFGEFHSRIAALTEENADLQKKIDTIDKLLGDEAAKKEYAEREAAFGASLQKVYDALMVQSEELAGVAEEITARESYTTILSIEKNGGISEILVAVAGAVIVFVIAAAICYAVVRRKDQTQPQQTAEPAPKEEDRA